MADSGMFKPQTSSSGMGKKKQSDGQFENPPAYVEVSGFTGPSKIGGESRLMSLEKTPGAKKGRV